MINDDFSDEEAAIIMECRRAAPDLVRSVATAARVAGEDAAEAVRHLRDRGFLHTDNPTDAELHRIENMPDEEIHALMRAHFH